MPRAIGRVITGGLMGYPAPACATSCGISGKAGASGSPSRLCRASPCPSTCARNRRHGNPGGRHRLWRRLVLSGRRPELRFCGAAGRGAPGGRTRRLNQACGNGGGVVGHPTVPEPQTISFVMFCARPEDPGAPYRNGNVTHPGRMDRSPCGTGTAARLAAMPARGGIGVGRRAGSALGHRQRVPGHDHRHHHAGRARSDVAPHRGARLDPRLLSAGRIPSATRCPMSGAGYRLTPSAGLNAWWDRPRA